MAMGDPTTLQAKTGFNFRFYYQSSAENETTPATPDEVVFLEVEGMKSGSLPSPDIPEIDVTTTTDAVKAYIFGTGAMTDISMDFNFYPQNTAHRNLVQNILYSDTPIWWKITGQGMSFTFLGQLKAATPSFGVDQALSMSLTLKVTSKPLIKWNDATAADNLRGFAADVTEAA